MTAFNRSLFQRGRRQDPRPSLRQTRMRSRVIGAAPLMDGLDWNGLPRDQLPEDPEHLPYAEVVRKVGRRRRIILHTRTQQLSGQQSRSGSRSGLQRRPKIILHVRRPVSSKSQPSSLPRLQVPEAAKPQLADWVRYHPGNSAAEMFASLRQAVAVWSSMGTALCLNNTPIKSEY